MKYAYLAGYTDGDGSIFCRTYIQKPSTKVYESSLQICSVDQNICNYFFHEFKGAVHKRPEKRNNRRDSWLWYVKGKQCQSILEEMINFLILKKRISILCCSLIENVSCKRSYKRNPVSESTHQLRQNIIHQIKEEIHMNDRIDENLFQSLKDIKKIKIPSNADFAYLAGLIDAEGCFRIQHWQPKRQGRSEHWVITLEIGNSKFSIFPWLLERFGGSIIYRKPTKSRHNAMIIWSLRSDALFQILPNIYPFLRVKKERCEKLVQFHQISIPLGGDRKSQTFKNHVMDVLHTRKILFDEFQILNAKGKH